jgi:hypothetical protein
MIDLLLLIFCCCDDDCRTNGIMLPQRLMSLRTKVIRIVEETQILRDIIATK